MDLPFKLPPDLQNLLNAGLTKLTAFRNQFDPTAAHRPSVSNVPVQGSAPTSLAPWQGIVGSPGVPGAVAPQPAKQGPGALGLGAAALSLGAIWYVIRDVKGGRSISSRRDPFDFAVRPTSARRSKKHRRSRR